MKPAEIALAAVLAAATAVSSPAEEPGVPTDPAPGPSGGGLAEDELARRREALATWTFEPVAIDAGSFLLHVDRRDGSFFVEDRRAGVRWFSSWGRRGFASALVRGEADPAGAPPPARWLRLDRVKDLSAEERKIRFTGGSSEGELPLIRFRFESPADSGSLLLEVEVPDESRGRIERVRILEDALWVPDAAGGGALIPAGAGEWHSASAPARVQRRLDGIAIAGDAPDGAMGWSLSALGLVQGMGPLLVRWDDPRTALDVARRAADGASFPGRAGLFTSIEVPVPREPPGPFAAGVEILPLGRSEQDPLVPLIQAARERQMRGLTQSTLRWKTGVRPELRPFAGAAILRASPGSGRGFLDVAAFAERLKGALEVDQAAIILGGWSAGGSGGPSALLPAAPAAGGDAGLKECARRVKDLGFIFGLEVEAGALLRAGDAGAAPSDGAAAWVAALDAGRREENLPALSDLCAPQLILIKEPARDLAGSDAPAALDARGAFVAHVKDAFGLAGMSAGAQADVPGAAYIEGLLGDFARDLPGKSEAWPFFPAVFGHAARLSAGAAPLGPDGAREFLALLLVGEVPVYGIPEAAGPGTGGGDEGAAGSDPSSCFAREGGWTAGKGLSAKERFLKNTFEVASRVARTRAKEIFFHHRSLAPDGRVRETRFGFDLRVLVNFGPGDYEDADDGVVLPPMGFLVKHPFLLAFHARRANGVDYEEPAFFVVHSLEGKMYLLAEKVRIYHGFGPDVIQLGGKTFRVEREEEVKIW